MSNRWKYWLLGWAAGVALYLPIAIFRSRWNFSTGFWLILGPILIGNSSLLFAQWRGKVKPVQAAQFLTLFPRDGQ
jgi:hypothetical protein